MSVFGAARRRLATGEDGSLDEDEYDTYDAYYDVRLVLLCVSVCMSVTMSVSVSVLVNVCVRG